MLKVKENNIKLQIWDTVCFVLFRLDRKASRLSPGATIEMQSGLSSSTISAIGTASTISPSGSKKPKPTDHLPSPLCLWEIKAISRLSTYEAT